MSWAHTRDDHCHRCNASSWNFNLFIVGLATQARCLAVDRMRPHLRCAVPANGSESVGSFRGMQMSTNVDTWDALQERWYLSASRTGNDTFEKRACWVGRGSGCCAPCDMRGAYVISIRIEVEPYTSAGTARYGFFFGSSCKNTNLIPRCLSNRFCTGQ